MKLKLRTRLTAILTAAALMITGTFICTADASTSADYDANGTADTGASVTLAPTGNDWSDTRMIINAVNSHDTVILQPGGTFHLSTPIHLKDNKTIIADGATVIADMDFVETDLNRADYQNVQNVTIQGGTWDSSSPEGYSRSSFAIVHGSNITMKNMTICHTNYDGHAIEIVACQNVLLDNITIIPKGTPGKSLETMVQIDIATDATYPRLKGTALSNGATCRNVTVSNCNITGNRSLATGYDYKKQGFVNRAHENITLLNNKLTSINAEGVFLVNVKKATVKGNTIVSKRNKKAASKSIGVYFFLAGKVKNATFNCTGNTVRGGANAIRAYSITKQKIKSVTIKKNKCYCKKGAKNAILASKSNIKKIKISKNKTRKWK